MTMVMEYMSGYSGMLMAALALLVIQVICDLSLPTYMSDIVNNGVLSGDVAYIVQIGVKMLLITLASAGCELSTGKCGRRGK